MLFQYEALYDKWNSNIKQNIQNEELMKKKQKKRKINNNKNALSFGYVLQFTFLHRC